MRDYIAHCLEKALLIIAAFAMAFVIGAGLSMGAVWGTAYMMQEPQP